MCTGSLYSNLSHCKFLNFKIWSNSFLALMEAGMADLIKKMYYLVDGEKSREMGEKTVTQR